MSRFIDLTGHKYGRWTVLKKADDHSVKSPHWDCQCECGTIKPVMRNHLRSGHSQSCGCLKTERASATNSAKLEGQRFGRLLVLERAGSKRQANNRKASSALWLCRCDCGKPTIGVSHKLTSGLKTSCGCAQREAMTTHGQSRTRVYKIWARMRKRCSPSADANTMPNYYGRGIRVCERWQSFENFIADMGQPSALETLDRIDPNKDYGPENCRWATMQQQARNTRRNKIVMVNGEAMYLTDAIAMLRDNAVHLHNR